MSAGKTTTNNGRVIGERYELIGSVGSGASAEVFQAKDLRLNRNVALKQLRPGLTGDSRFIKLFRSEAQIVAQLSHRNILTVFDWSDDPDNFDGGAYIVSEFLNGGTLKDLLLREPVLSLSQVCHIGLQAARGVAAAHRQGLVHRDIKPGNLLFDVDGRVAVGDFGIARAVAEAAWTEPEGVLIGTARYAAPEQATDDAVSGLVDVYSLTLCLVEALTGEVPLVRENALGTMLLRQRDDVPINEAMGALIEPLAWGGAANPEERATAAELVSSLETAQKLLPEAEPLNLIDMTDRGRVSPAVKSSSNRPDKKKKKKTNKLRHSASPSQDGPLEIDVTDSDRHSDDRLSSDTPWGEPSSAAKGELGRSVNLSKPGDNDHSVYDFEADDDDVSGDDSADEVFDPAGAVANVRFDDEGGLIIGDADQSLLSLPAAEDGDETFAETNNESPTFELGEGFESDDSFTPVVIGREAFDETDEIGEVDSFSAAGSGGAGGYGDEAAEIGDDSAEGPVVDDGLSDTEIDGMLSSGFGRRLVVGALLVVGLLGVAGFGFWRFVVVEGSITEIDLGLPAFGVEQYVGMDEAEAAALAKDSQGSWTLVTEQTRKDGTTAGEIVSQTPAKDTPLPFGGAITLQISQGQQLRPIPDVTGQNETDAATSLTENGFTLAEKTTTRFDENIETGVVLDVLHDNEPIDYTAAEPVTLETDTELELVVSAGPAPREIPKVVGLSETAAKTAMTNAGLTPKTSYAFSTRVNKGVVITSNPTAGKTAPRGSTIELQISKGVEMVTIPNVTGLDASAAARKLRSVGLIDRNDGGSAARPVKGTKPVAGTSVAKGSTIVLVQ